MRYFILLVVVLISCISVPVLGLKAVSAEPFAFPKLSFPLQCTINQNCWIVKYRDDDSGPGWKDYKGNNRTDNGHSGTDFLIDGMKAMKLGVPVLAVASGKVVAVRDSVDDINVNEIGVNAVQGHECGNRVTLLIAPGWVADYCHLRRGSVKVALGDQVDEGQPLALVGMSGLAELPHLHFTIQHFNQSVDPFQGDATIPHSLWSPQTLSRLPYQPVLLYSVGIADHVPYSTEVRKALARNQPLTSNAPAIVVWAETFGVQKGDQIQVKIFDPKRHLILENTRILDKAFVQYFAAIGKKLKPDSAWATGSYQAEVTLRRLALNVSQTKMIHFNVSP